MSVVQQMTVEEFAAYASTWLAENAERRPADAAERLEGPARFESGTRFQASQYAAGLSGITWPADVGGQGLGPEYQRAFNQRARDYVLPSQVCQITLAILGMTLLDHGSDEQKRRYLPEMLRGEAIWVQLLSEPGAGSDLAALTTRATPTGRGTWVLNGGKLWSTDAQYSRYGMCLARTDWDVPKHEGLTMFIVDLRAPGVTVSPLRQLSGDNEFCQEFLDDAEVPADAVLGGVGGGWPVATSLFNHSRTMTAGGGVAGPAFASSRGGDLTLGPRLAELARRRGRGAEDHVAELIGEAIMLNLVSGQLAPRCVAAMAGGVLPPSAGSLAKLFGVVISQRVAAIQLAVAGFEGIAWTDPGDGEDDFGASGPAFDYLKARTNSVAGGTDEILRNTVGERVLHLPKEPAVDRGIPFSRLPRN